MLIVFCSDIYFEKIYHALSRQGLKIAYLICEPPKKQGRGLKLKENQAHRFAKKIGLPVLSAEKLDQPNLNRIKNIISGRNVKLGLVFAYGQIIPVSLIDAFPFKIINIHPSLLPKYRGPSPLQAALLKGDDVSGFTIILLDRGCDTGPILYQKKIEVQKNDDAISLKEKILDKAIYSLAEIIRKYLSGKISPKNQKTIGVSQTSKISKQEAEIKKTDTALRALRKIRAFADWPRAYLIIGEKRLTIHKAEIKKNKLVIQQIQIAGKNKITFEDFKRGYPNLLTEMPNFVKI